MNLLDEKVQPDEIEGFAFQGERSRPPHFGERWCPGHRNRHGDENPQDFLKGRSPVHQEAQTILAQVDRDAGAFPAVSAPCGAGGRAAHIAHRSEEGESLRVGWLAGGLIPFLHRILL